MIREAEFAQRLEQACEAHSLCPPKYHGQLGWIQQQFKQRFAQHVSTESVRKWFNGEFKPRPLKMGQLAEILEVDATWLALGIDAGGSEPRERRARNALAGGAVNVIAGLIQMDGGHPSFPDPAREPVDLTAVIRGARYDINISVGEPASSDPEKMCFCVPANHDGLLLLGVVKDGFDFQVFELDAEMIAAGTPRKAQIEISVAPSEIRKRRIVNFTQRI